MRVYVIDINGDEVGTFDLDFRKGDLYTYKEDIEAWLFENNLPEGDYCFTAKLIAKEGSETTSKPLTTTTSRGRPEDEEDRIAIA